MSEYVEEELESAGLRFGFQLKKRLYSKTSPFQKVEVVETSHHGRALLNDGFYMLTERDEAVYHEMMAHVPLFVHPNPERVLIIGGGDGGTAREVLRHPSVKRCVMVEIDGAVVDACREWIPQTASALQDERLELKIEDGVKFLKESKEIFDVILVDSTDPIGPAKPLFGEDFYQDIFDHLSEDGISVSQAESVFYQEDMQKTLACLTSARFQWMSFYNFSNMAYPGGLWSFMLASKQRHPLKDLNVQKVLAADLSCFYYTPEIHRAAFALPAFQKERLKPWIKL